MTVKLDFEPVKTVKVEEVVEETVAEEAVEEAAPAEVEATDAE
jgi:hypothetical protein